VAERDPYGTEELRTRVTAAWADSPARFREDANAEEELVRGAYRDRVLVELAQNAVDAGGSDGTRVRLEIWPDRLVVANTGAPLDAAGVESMSTLRASAKRFDEQVGRFGVGFAAVLTLTDTPQVVSADGAVWWSREHAAQVAATIPPLGPELQRRGKAVPVLRLPFAEGDVHRSGSEDRVPDGYDTAVILPFRDDDARSVAAALVGGLDETLLLALPGLTELTVADMSPQADRVPDRSTRWSLRTEPVPDEPAGSAGSDEPTELDKAPTVSRVRIAQEGVPERHWWVATSGGVVDPVWLADRTTEEQERTGWSVTVAVPESAETQPPGVVLAPTPTDDPHGLPALVVGSFPLDSNRRRIAEGAYTDALVDYVGEAFAALVRVRARTGTTATGLAAMVPAAWGMSALDTGLRAATRQALSRTSFVRAGDEWLSPPETVRVPGLSSAADGGVLAPMLPGLPDAEWWQRDVLDDLGAHVLPLPEVVDALAGVELEPRRWAEVYDGLRGADTEALRALPVPLVDGRTVSGPRGVLVPKPGPVDGYTDPEVLASLGSRVVHPAAAHPLLLRLGAVEAGPRAALHDPQVRERLLDPDIDAATVDAVLQLVGPSGTGVAEVSTEDEPWLAGIHLPDATGVPVPAGELLLPESPVLRWLEVDPAEFTVDAGVVERHGAVPLRALGVRESLGVQTQADLALVEGEGWPDVDDVAGWVDHVRAAVERATALGDERLPEGPAVVPPVIAEFAAIQDLDLVSDDAWPQVLVHLAADPVTRAAVVQPTHVLLGDGRRIEVRSYTAWWLRQYAVIEDHRLDEVCIPEAGPLVRGLFTPVPLDVDHDFAAAIGVVTELAAAEPTSLLRRLANPQVTLTAADLASVYQRLAVAATGAQVDPPARIRVPDGTGTRVVAASEVVVVDGPHWLQLDLGAVVPGPVELADLLDVDLADDVYDVAPAHGGRATPVGHAAAVLLTDAPETYVEHDDLVVAGRSVDWWVHDEVVHAATTDGLARGLAWVCGQWFKRWELAEVLADPSVLLQVLAEDAFGALSDPEQGPDR